MRLARSFTGLRTEYGVKPFKCLLIRPSTFFPRSRRALFHSTSNYFNPVIAQRAPGLTVRRDTGCWGDECVDTSVATGVSSACLPPLGLCSSGLYELCWLYCAKNKTSRDCLYSCQQFHLKGLETSWWIQLTSFIYIYKIYLFFSPRPPVLSCTLFFL